MRKRVRNTARGSGPAFMQARADERGALEQGLAGPAADPLAGGVAQANDFLPG
jgi:hypothetical protein